MQQMDNSHSQDDSMNYAGAQETIALLKRQNHILEQINQNLAHAMQREDESRNTMRARIADIDMSIGSMIRLAFKWLVASLVIGLIVAVIGGGISLLFGGLGMILSNMRF